MNLHLGLITKVCFVILLVLNVVTASAATEETGLVEVEHYQDYLAPYRERRADNGAYFAVSYQPLVMKNYVSFLDGSTYGDIFGTAAIPMIDASFNYKRNFALGSIAAGIEYGGGQISGSLAGASGSRTLTISKIGAVFQYTADVLMPEPYVAPYIAISVWQMDIGEKSDTDKFSATTKPGYNYTIGALLQLDWIDYDNAKNTTFNWGLENTFIDIYATQYAKTQAADDPDTSTSILFGGGLRLEF
jgi:hypothetical protein